MCFRLKLLHEVRVYIGANDHGLFCYCVRYLRVVDAVRSEPGHIRACVRRAPCTVPPLVVDCTHVVAQCRLLRVGGVGVTVTYDQCPLHRVGEHGGRRYAPHRDLCRTTGRGPLRHRRAHVAAIRDSSRGATGHARVVCGPRR